MTKVKVVNRQEIDGTKHPRGAVIDIDDGRARDLINRGKVVEATDAEVERAESENREAEAPEQAGQAETGNAPATAEPDPAPKKTSAPRAAKKPVQGEKEAQDG